MLNARIGVPRLEARVAATGLAVRVIVSRLEIGIVASRLHARFIMARLEMPVVMPRILVSMHISSEMIISDGVFAPITVASLPTLKMVQPNGIADQPDAAST